MITLFEKMSHLEAGWLNALKEEVLSEYMENLAHFIVDQRQKGYEVYPPTELVFNALEQTPFDDVKVVIMGQDPYHGPNQAHGLSFSVPGDVKVPPSLRNIYQELHTDLGIAIPEHGDLTSWARQGVLLLNATLTVQAHEPKSHYNKGWERFTDACIRALCRRKDPVIYFLWGKSAKEKCESVMKDFPARLEYVLTAPHPSPYSAHSGFFGCRHFSQANALLEKLGKEPIDWNVPAQILC